LEADEIWQELRRADPEKQSMAMVARNLSLEQAIALKSLNLPSVVIADDYSRSYKDGPIFAQVLGYYSGFVKTGLEAVYDEQLRGRDGVSLVLEDVRGRALDRKTISEPVAGQKLITTLDAGLQRFFYQRLHEQLQQLNSDGGVGLALNPQNGEVLSLISLPSFDNNLFAVVGHNQEKKTFVEFCRAAIV